LSQQGKKKKKGKKTLPPKTITIALKELKWGQNVG